MKVIHCIIVYNNTSLQTMQVSSKRLVKHSVLHTIKKEGD